jgi:tRNA(fMet)-specific endonuclease VapC
MKKILLDTNAYSHFLRGDEKVLDALSAADEIFLSVIVMGELYAGFRGGKKEAENKAILDAFRRKPGVQMLLAGEETARIFGDIKFSPKSAGNPIPINDVWIAAQTMETGSVLVTFDRHFQNVAGLRLWDGI